MEFECNDAMLFWFMLQGIRQTSKSIESDKEIQSAVDTLLSEAEEIMSRVADRLPEDFREIYQIPVATEHT